MTTHRLEPDEQTLHGVFSRELRPVLTVDSGDTVVLTTRDVSDNQIGPESDASVIADLDWDRVAYGRLEPASGLHGAEPLFPRIDAPAAA